MKLKKKWLSKVGHNELEAIFGKTKENVVEYNVASQRKEEKKNILHQRHIVQNK